MTAEKPVDIKLATESYDIIDKTVEKYMSERELRDQLMAKNKPEDTKPRPLTCAGCLQELKPPLKGLPDWYAFKLSYTNIANPLTDNEACIQLIPLFTGDKYFCNKKCLIEWLNKLK
jgi:hypothetical protein